MLKRVLIILVVMTVTGGLILTNPPESRYLEKIALDYGRGHKGSWVGTELLMEIGKGQRKSYVFFSTYHYEFGNVGVNYFGIATWVIRMNSYTQESLKSQQDRQT